MGDYWDNAETGDSGDVVCVYNVLDSREHAELLTAECVTTSLFKSIEKRPEMCGEYQQKRRGVATNKTSITRETNKQARCSCGKCQD